MQNLDPSLEKRAHPFELSGLGTGPYRWVGLVSIPSPSVAEANPFAYNNALQALPRDLENGCGACAHCLTPIMNICIVTDGQGRKWGIGSDCIAKVGGPYLADKAKIAVAKLQREQRRARAAAKRVAAHQRWLAEIDPATGETNAVMVARKAAATRDAQKREEAERKARQAEVWNKFAFLVPALRAASRTDGDFCYNMVKRLEYGTPLEGRPLDICLDIYARQFGRRDSKGYQAALNDAANRTEETHE